MNMKKITLITIILAIAISSVSLVCANQTENEIVNLKGVDFSIPKGYEEVDNTTMGNFTRAKYSNGTVDIEITVYDEDRSDHYNNVPHRTATIGGHEGYLLHNSTCDFRYIENGQTITIIVNNGNLTLIEQVVV